MKRLCMQAAFMGYIFWVGGWSVKVTSNKCGVMVKHTAPSLWLMPAWTMKLHWQMECYGARVWVCDCPWLLLLISHSHWWPNGMKVVDLWRWLYVCVYVWVLGGNKEESLSMASEFAQLPCRIFAPVQAVAIGANECAWRNCWGVQPKYRWHSLLRTLPR